MGIHCLNRKNSNFGIAGIEGEKSPAPHGNRTHDISVIRHALYCCATTSGQNLIKTSDTNQSVDGPQPFLHAIFIFTVGTKICDDAEKKTSSLKTSDSRHKKYRFRKIDPYWNSGYKVKRLSVHLTSAKLVHYIIKLVGYKAVGL